MGTPYLTAVGVPPVCTSKSFQNWYMSLIAYRLLECPIARATTYYVDPASGNDTNSGLTTALPFKTLAKAESVLTTSNVAVLLKRGTVFHQTRSYSFSVISGGAVGTNNITVDKISTGNYAVPGQSVTLTGGTSEILNIASAADSGPNTIYTFTANIANAGHTALTITVLDGITMTAPHCTIGTYGQGLAPIISGFNIYYNANSFDANTVRGDNYTRTWSISDSNNLAVFRELNDAETPYRFLQGGSIALVDATPGSWWQDTAAQKIYVHFPNEEQAHTANNGLGSGRNFEGASVNSCNGIRVGINTSLSDIRIDGVRVDGYGAGSMMAVYGIHGNADGTDACVLSNCQAYYNGNHSFGILSGNIGGIVTYYRCRGGLVTSGAPFVFYSQTGGHESNVIECECHISQQPIGVQPANGIALIGHTAYVNFGIYTVSQPTLTIPGNALSWIWVGIVAGMQLTLTGGTSETLTVASYNVSTGVITFTSPIANAGHTGLNCTLSGVPVSYASSLHLQVGCRVPAGQFQPSTPFGGVSSGMPWTDLTGCRNFVINDVMQTRWPGYIDNQQQLVPLTAAAQTGYNVTLTTPVSSVLGPNYDSLVLLSGGTSPAEWGRVSVYNAGTGVISLCETPIGTGRTSIVFTISSGNSAIYPVPYRASTGYSAFINCKWEGGITQPLAFGVSGVYDVYVPDASNVFFNCQFIMDNRGTLNPQGTAYRGIFQAGGSALKFASFYNCLFWSRAAGNDYATVDSGTATGSGVSQLKIYNSLVMLDTSNSAQNTTTGSPVGIGNIAANQANNAYAGCAFTTDATGYSNDPYYVELPTQSVIGHPEPASPLLSTHNQLVASPSGATYRLEYDALWGTRNPTVPAIGPFEPFHITASSKGSRPSSKGGH